MTKNRFTMSRDPQAGLSTKRLNETMFRRGDIVLVTTTSVVSAAIRTATRSDISHAMVYVEDYSVIDATDEGVHARNTQRLVIEESCPVHVLRLRTQISVEQLSAVQTFLRRHIGTRYSKKEAVLAGLGGARSWTRQQFCSRLVAQAFQAGGIQLVSDTNYCSPADLKASPLLRVIPNATLPMAPEEAVRWKEHQDVPQLMRDAINAVLDGARSRNASIETFDDLHAHLIAHPDQDAEMCLLLGASGYLTVWQIESAKNPWQFDRALMDAAPADEIEDYCWSVLANEDHNPHRYVLNRGGYSLLARQHGLQFFRIMADLYEHLATLHHQRVSLAAEWLKARGHLPSERQAPLVPHSAAWFAALENWDPAQAMMTRQIIRLAGRTDVCSVCGDDPASDYRLIDGYRPAGGVDTLRLCYDCVGIRRGQGEPFVSLTPSGVRAQPEEP